MKLSQELRLTQKLSPLQIQTIKLLELPIQDLEQRIRKELEENPVLDEDDKVEKDSETGEEEPRQISLSEYKDDGNIAPYNLYTNLRGKDERPQYNAFSVKESFTDTLEEQLGCRDLNEHEKSVASFIIGSLDDDGYLRRDLDSIVDDLAFRCNIETTYNEVLHLLQLIQEFEPAGVGARDLRECLLLQLQRHSSSEAVKDAVTIVSDHFQDFTAKHFDKIRSKTGLSQDRLKAAMSKILRLNPSPGGQADDSYNDRAQQVVPDFVLEDNNGEPQITMPRFNIPELKVNKKYSDILTAAEGSTEREKKEAATFVKQKLDSAKWFVEALKQRHNTLMKTMQAILEFQRDFFLDGDENHLKPMVLKDIAEKTGFDISTISRVVNSKFIETDFGIYPLKYFFSEGLENQEGEEVSTRELKKALREIIDAEDKNNPLTDSELVDLMTERGYKVARRTIAKYRDQLGLSTARLRKELV